MECEPLCRGDGLIKRVTRERTSFWFDPGAEPSVIIESGESLVVEAQDAHSGTITGTDVVYSSYEDVLERIGGANPVTGPIQVQGVSAGDLLEIEVLDVVGAPVHGFGYMNTTPTLDPTFRPETTVCHKNGDEVEIPTHKGPVSVPCEPFIGTLGIAPDGEPLESFRQSREVLGNVDLPPLCAGARVVVRANVPGGMISLGDAHLAQGDAEIHRSAIEAQADVTLRVKNLRDGRVPFGNLPQINHQHEIGSVAPGPGHLEDLVRAAYDDLALRMRDGYGFTLPEAYRVLGAVGRVRIGQVVPPVFSAMATIKRSYIEEESQS